MTDNEESFEDTLQHVAEEAVHALEDLGKDIRSGFESLSSSFPHLDEWVKALQLKNGRYCGPGEDLSQPVTPIDPCCQKHDDTYTSLGYDFSSMWSIKALLATRDADAALVSCVNGTDPAGMDEVTVVYKAGLIAGFQGRVDIADWLKQQGYGS